MEKGKIGVVMVDDDPDWLNVMTGFLNRESDIAIVGYANKREETLELIKKIQFDVVLMDINLTENKYDGICLAMELLQILNTKIIMLTSIKNDNIVLDSFTAGAVQYISKENYTDLPNAIRVAYNNTSSIEVLLKEFSRLKENEQLDVLTPVEKEIYRYIENGYSQSQIAKMLYKSTNTIKKQVGSVLDKLGVNSSKEAVKKVKMKGLFHRVFREK